jgi:hypothetical protein
MSVVVAVGLTGNRYSQAVQAALDFDSGIHQDCTKWSDCKESVVLSNKIDIRAINYLLGLIRESIEQIRQKIEDGEPLDKLALWAVNNWS